MKLRKPTGWGIVDLAARLAVLAALLFAWHADDNGLALALSLVIGVWSVAALGWTLIRRGRMT